MGLGHTRQDGHLEAWRVLNTRVQADLEAGRGEIKPARVRFAYYDTRKLHSVSRWITQAIRLVKVS